MNSDLIVMTFPVVDGGHRVWRATEILRDRQTLGLEYAAVVTKTGDGRPVIHHYQRLPVHPHRPEQVLLERLAGEIFGRTADEAPEKLVEAGVDRLFVQGVRDAMGPDSSALMIYIPYDGVADVEQLVEILTLLQGSVNHSTLPRQVEEMLRNHW